MLFSVIIPTFNRLNYLPQTLASVFAQTFRDFEVIVVDDGSTDGTLDYLRSLGADVKVLVQANAGAGAARNAGANIARGDYLAFLDSDDLWFPWTLSVIAGVLTSHGGPSVVAGCIKPFKSPEELPAAPGSLRVAAFADYFKGGRAGYFVGSGMAVLGRAAFLRVGGFHTLRMNAEDHDLILRMGREPGFVQILSPITIGWRQHSTSETRLAKRTFEGVKLLVDSEKSGSYPGGEARKPDRRIIISRHVRSTVLECLSNGLGREAWRLYFASLRWQLAAGRFKFVIGLPLMAAIENLRSAQRS